MIRRLAPWSAPLIFIAVLFYLPVIRVLLQGVSLSSSDLDVVVFTIAQALASTILTLLLAVPVAYGLFRRRFYGANFFQAAIALPFLLPTIVVAIALRDYVAVFRSFLSAEDAAIAGILLAHIFLNLGLVVRAVGARIDSLDAEIDEAAMLDGATGFRRFISIQLPQLRSTIASVSVLVFLYSATSFGVIRLLGAGRVETIETEIFNAALRDLDIERASQLALIQTVITIAAFLASSKLSGIGISLGESTGKKANWLTWSSLVFMGLLFLLPLGSIVLRSFQTSSGFGFENFINLASRGSRNLLNISVLDALANSLQNMLLATVIAFSIALLVARLSKDRTNLALPFLLPLGVSAVVLGLGYLIGFSGIALIEPIRDSFLLIPLAQAVIALPLAIKLLQSAFGSIPKEFSESAILDGATGFQQLRLIELPILRSSWRNTVAFIALISLGEFSAASFLATGDAATVTTLLFRLISRPGGENYGMAMATTTIIIVLSLVILAIANWKNSPRAQLSAR